MRTACPLVTKHDFLWWQGIFGFSSDGMTFADFHLVALTFLLISLCSQNICWFPFVAQWDIPIASPTERNIWDDGKLGTQSLWLFTISLSYYTYTQPCVQGDGWRKGSLVMIIILMDGIIVRRDLFVRLLRTTLGLVRAKVRQAVAELGQV